VQQRQPEVPLIPILDKALSYANKAMWEEAVRACNEAGKSDLPEQRRRTFTPLAEALDKA
jgi:hypothetical protein